MAAAIREDFDSWCYILRMLYYSDTKSSQLNSFLKLQLLSSTYILTRYLMHKSRCSSDGNQQIFKNLTFFSVLGLTNNQLKFSKIKKFRQLMVDSKEKNAVCGITAPLCMTIGGGFFICKIRISVKGTINCKFFSCTG